MNPFNEVKEIKNQATKEIGNKTKAFENTSSEVREVRHIPTINEKLEGKTYPGTNVEYRKRIFKLNGEWVEGVFPKFDSKFDTGLPKNLWMASDNDQLIECTKKLKQRIESDSEFAKGFTPRQIEQIKAGEKRITGLTWHHNEIPGRMQLVNSETHQICRHTGGRSIWGGGSECR